MADSGGSSCDLGSVDTYQSLSFLSYRMRIMRPGLLLSQNKKAIRFLRILKLPGTLGLGLVPSSVR